MEAMVILQQNSERPHPRPEHYLNCNASLDELVSESASNRFATLIHELAAEHAFQVAELRKELREVRAAARLELVTPAASGESRHGSPRLPGGTVLSSSRKTDADAQWVPEDDAAMDPLQCARPGERVSHSSEAKSADRHPSEQAGHHPSQEEHATRGFAQTEPAFIEADYEADDIGEYERGGAPAAAPRSGEDEDDTAGGHHFSYTLSEMSSLKHTVINAISVKFDMIIGACIVGNALVMAMEIEYTGRKFQQTELRGCTGDCGRVQLLEDFFTAAEHSFCAIFALELMIRLKCEGIKYLYLISNLLDALIVTVSVVDLWVLGPLGDDSMGNVAILRLMRLMRLAKVLRVVRVMKAFPSLRVLVGAVANSVGALGWSMTLLFVLELIGAILMAQVAMSFMEDGNRDLELREYMFVHFGTWSSAMFSIFEVTMAPGGFVKYRRLYEEVHFVFGIFFVVYVCIVTFAVVRVITALFLKTTLAASASDEHALAQERNREHVEYVAGLKAFCLDGDSDNNDSLSREKLRILLKTPHFKKWLKEVSLDAATISNVYLILEQGGNRRVAFDEWADATLQLARPTQHVETVFSLLQTRSIFNRLIEVEQLVYESVHRSGSRPCARPPVSEVSSKM